ncbi:MAG: hypothetical protein K6T86_20630 [Pirellulales bacterium]|nr:hypothetical protein [Pirellulales bacterium]
MQRLLIAVPLALALLLGGSAGHLARRCLAAELTLEDLIELVRQNELLYENIDVTVRKQYAQNPAIANKAGPVIGPDGIKSKAVRESETVIRYVRQGELYRRDLRFQGHHVGDEEPQASLEMGAFDGTTTRLRQDHIGNIVAGRYGLGGPVLAHGFFTLMGYDYVPLSVKLQGEQALRAYPEGQLFLSNDTEHLAEYRGVEEFQGLTCHVVWLPKVWSKGKPQAGEVISRAVYWLAEERNFIPVRYQSYVFRESKTIPRTEGTVTEWTEIQPGVWFPKHVIIETLDGFSLARGERVPNWRCEWFTEAVSLAPQHDISFFRDIPFPDGTIVYEVEGGQIKKGYQVGAPAVPAPAPGVAAPKRLNLAPLVAALLAVGIALAGVILWKRRHPQKARGDS